MSLLAERAAQACTDSGSTSAEQQFRPCTIVTLTWSTAFRHAGAWPATDYV